MPATASAEHDVLVIGGGPSGATAALQLARAGLGVTVLERQAMPRFQIGESLLPRTFAQLHALGLGERLAELPRTRKLGAEFVLGHGKRSSSWARFATSLSAETEAVNIERAPFDAMLLDAAREAGAEVRQAKVRRILKLEDGDVRLEVEQDGERSSLGARYLVDASGQATVVGRHLGQRQVLPHLRRVAYYGHFRGVERHGGEEGGYIVIVMCAEGWFWMIPLDEERTSIGLVIDEAAMKRSGVPAKQMLSWAIERCPVVAERCRSAEPPERTWVSADFSYTCQPYAGPGYFLAGDAATFIDPIFSTGVCLGMMSGEQAADAVVGILRHGARPEPLRRRYRRFIRGSSQVFFRLVEQFYDPAFRDLFITEKGPLEVHRAVISVLVGDVYPRPRFAVRWRLAVMELCRRLQRHFTLAPRHEPFSLLAADKLERPVQTAAAPLDQPRARTA